jgi:hypothetical protein
MRRNGTVLISALLVVIGVVVIARTVQAGVGGGLGLSSAGCSSPPAPSALPAEAVMPRRPEASPPGWRAGESLASSPTAGSSISSRWNRRSTRSG